MSMVFEKAEAIPQSGSGRKAEPNPFTEIIAEIALKKDDSDKPEARAFTQEYSHDGSEQAEKEYVTLQNRIKRQMSEAGAANNPPVTVPVRFSDSAPVKNKKNTHAVRVTFWTVKRQERPRTATPISTDSAPAS